MHVMLDLETLGTTPDAAFFDIGAVAFTIDGVIHDRFSRQIKMNSAVEGRAVSGDTVVWWLGQSEEARQKITRTQSGAGDQMSGIGMALIDLSDWVEARKKAHGLAGVWSNGATFDIPMLEHAFRQNGMDVPWPFWLTRDCRTVEAMAKEIGVERSQCVRQGVHHSALDDAVYQAAYVSAMWRALTGNTRRAD